MYVYVDKLKMFTYSNPVKEKQMNKLLELHHMLTKLSDLTLNSIVLSL